MGVLGYIQLRKGPNKPRMRGLLTPLADALKLITKENVMPYFAYKLYNLIPLFSLMIPLIMWGLYPGRVPYKYRVLLFVCFSSLSVYCILGAGWRSNRKYTVLGSIRAVAQSVSYEVSIIFILLQCMLFTFYSFKRMMRPLCTFIGFCLISLFVIFLAESNRSPFDFSEGESELVRGFNTEYRSVSFVIIFLAEYISILFLALVLRVLYHYTNTAEIIFTALWGLAFIWARGTIPRLRYDQLIAIAWKSFLPVSIVFLTIFLNF